MTVAPQRRDLLGVRWRPRAWRPAAGRALLLALVGSPALDAQPAVPVPGGTSAVERLLGPVDGDPELFTLSLNRLLLSSSDRDHRWESLPLRSRLVRYLETMRELKARFPGAITVGAEDRTERRAFEQLAGTLGFGADFDRRRGFRILPRNDAELADDAAFGRLVAQALGLHLEAIAARIGTAGSEVIDIPTDQVAAPIPEELWEALTGTALGADALAVLAADQRLGLVIEGRRRMSRESHAAFDGMDVRWFYRHAPIAFRRHAPALRVEGGRVVVPGGESARAAWERILETSTNAPASFFRDLLERRRAAGAYLWHSLHHAPAPVTAYYLGRTGSAEGLRFARTVLARLESGTPDALLATELGLAGFARSVPIEGDPPHLPLPGGPGLWLEALTGASPPASVDELAAVVRRGARRTLEEPAFVLEVLAATADRAGADADVMARLIRSTNFFWQHPRLATPENVVLVARASGSLEPALAVLEAIDIREPEVAQSYLLAVSRLHRGGADGAREQLVAAFQGGVEWLRLMAASGKVDHGLLERHLRSWAAIHGGDDADDAAPARLTWVADVLRSLPPVPERSPGRGPLERAMLDALAAADDSDFTWRGIRYESVQERGRAALMLEALEFFAIPPADLLVRLGDVLRDLATRCELEDLPRAVALAAQLQELVAELPQPSSLGGGGEIGRRLASPGREKIIAMAREIAAAKRPGRLAAHSAQVAGAHRQLADDLRAFLIAPAYVAPLGDRRRSLVQDRDLVRKHRLTHAEKVARAWTAAAVERDPTDGVGAYLIGHVGTVDAALATFTLSTAQLRTAHGIDRSRARAWHHHLATAPWHRLGPQVTAAVRRTLDLGWAIVGRADGEMAAGAGPLLDLALEVIPYARLENEAQHPERGLVSPGEAFAVGLLALERVPAGDAHPEVRGAELSAARAAVDALGAEWRKRLEVLGPSTPRLNGKASPWIGPWPAYEALELDRVPEALVEREVIDLHLVVLGYLGGEGLPGTVGSVLMRRVMEDLAANTRLQDERDWESMVRSLRRIDDDYFETRWRECLRDGWYRLLQS